MPPQQPGQQPAGLTQVFVKFAQASSFAFYVLVGGAVGYFLDRKLHTAPWLLLAFGLLGFALGVLEILRVFRTTGSGGGPGRPQA